jgi:hypothetical protein
VATASFFAMQMWWLDARVQRYRAPSAPRGAFWIIPLRWQRKLYVAEGSDVVGQVWQAWRRMLGSGLVGMLMLAYAAS